MILWCRHHHAGKVERIADEKALQKCIQHTLDIDVAVLSSVCLFV